MNANNPTATVNRASDSRVEIQLRGDRKNWRETKASAYELAAACIRETVDSKGRAVYEGAIYVEQPGDMLALVIFETMGGLDTDRAEVIAEVNASEFNRARN